MDKIYRRKLSVSERLWLGANEAYPPFANQFIIEGHGNIDYASLCHAVEVASQANPGSRLILKGYFSGCQWVDSGITPPVRVVDGTKWDGRSGENAPFMKRNLPYKGPTCEVVCIKGNPTRIAFRSNHAVMDGVGMLFWMEDIFRVLRHEQPIGALSTISDYELIESLSGRKAKVEHIVSIAPTGNAGKKAKGLTWKRITVTGVHSNMLGRIAVALAKSAWTYQDGRFNVAVPVNLRQRFEGPRSTGNLSNTVYFEVTKDSTPESVAKDLRKQLDNKNDCINIDRGFNMNLLPIWLIGLIVRIAARIVMRRGLFGAPIVVSNMGRMNLGNFCIDGFIADSIFPIPPMGEVAPAFVGIIGSGDKIDIVTSVPNMISDNGRLDKLVDDIRNIFI
jgi:NRPS condensation-like uncharacterized protein